MVHNGTGTSLDCFCHATCDPGGMLSPSMVHGSYSKYNTVYCKTLTNDDRFVKIFLSNLFNVFPIKATISSLSFVNASFIK